VLSTAAVLEWLDVKSGPFGSREETYAQAPGAQILQAPDGSWFALARLPVIRGTDLRDARLTQSDRGWATSFILSQDAAKRFGTYTAANIGRRAAIVLDHKILSLPIIEGRINDSGQIYGARSREEAAELALNLRTGSLPASVSITAQ